MKHRQQDIDDTVAAILSLRRASGTIRVPNLAAPPPRRALTHQEQNAQWVQVYLEEFPHRITANISALMDAGAQEWLITNVGEVGVQWRIVTDYPTDRLDTYLFKNKEHALWFKMSFA